MFCTQGAQCGPLLSRNKVAGRVVRVHHHNGARSLMDRRSERLEVDAPTAGMARADAGVIHQRVLAHDHIVKLGQQVKQGIARPRNEHGVARIAQQAKQVAVGLTRARRQANVLGRERCIVLQVVRHHRLTSGAHAERIRRVVQSPGVGQGRQHGRTRQPEAACRRVRHGQVEEIRLGGSCRAHSRRPGVLPGLPSCALRKLHRALAYVPRRSLRAYAAGLGLHIAPRLRLYDRAMTSNAPAKISAVLFDYGLVLTGPPDPAAWERMRSLFGVEEPAFHAAYWQHRPDYDRGTLSGVRFWQAVGTDLGHTPSSSDIAALIEADNDLWTQPNQPMIDWAAHLQANGVRTGILSNLGDEMETGVLARCGWLADFDHHTFSHRLNTIKPDPAIYRHAAGGLEVPLERVLFIDDREDNIAGARAVGMQAIQYTEYPAFLGAMQAAGFGDLLAPVRSS